VFVTFYDAIKFLGLKEHFPNAYKLFGILFAISFLAIRVVWWPIVSYDFWMRNLYLLRKRTYHSELVIFTFLAGNIFTTALQFFWGWSIVKLLIVKMNSPWQTPAQEEKKGAGEAEKTGKKEGKKILEAETKKQK